VFLGFFHVTQLRNKESSTRLVTNLVAETRIEIIHKTSDCALTSFEYFCIRVVVDKKIKYAILSNLILVITQTDVRANYQKNEN